MRRACTIVVAVLGALAASCTSSGPSKAASPSAGGPVDIERPHTTRVGPSSLDRWNGPRRPTRRDPHPHDARVVVPLAPVWSGRVAARLRVGQLPNRSRGRVRSHESPRGAAVTRSAGLGYRVGAVRREDFPPRPKRFFLGPSTLSAYECSGSHVTLKGAETPISLVTCGNAWKDPETDPPFLPW